MPDTKPNRVVFYYPNGECYYLIGIDLENFVENLDKSILNGTNKKVEWTKHEPLNNKDVHDYLTLIDINTEDWLYTQDALEELLQKQNNMDLMAYFKNHSSYEVLFTVADVIANQRTKKLDATKAIEISNKLKEIAKELL